MKFFNSYSWIAALSLVTSAAAFADVSCREALDAKDALIESLDAQISLLKAGSQSGNSDSSGWTCEAVCIENLEGKGLFHAPGKLYRDAIDSFGPNPKAAFDRLVSNCSKKAKATFDRHPGVYASASVAGLVTKKDMNGNDWENRMVSSFSDYPIIRKFCFSNE